jgi:hypothetical protein
MNKPDPLLNLASVDLNSRRDRIIVGDGRLALPAAAPSVSLHREGEPRSALGRHRARASSSSPPLNGPVEFICTRQSPSLIRGVIALFYRLLNSRRAGASNATCGRIAALRDCSTLRPGIALLAEHERNVNGQQTSEAALCAESSGHRSEQDSCVRPRVSTSPLRVVSAPLDLAVLSGLGSSTVAPPRSDVLRTCPSNRLSTRRNIPFTRYKRTLVGFRVVSANVYARRFSKADSFGRHSCAPPHCRATAGCSTGRI